MEIVIPQVNEKDSQISDINLIINQRVIDNSQNKIIHKKTFFTNFISLYVPRIELEKESNQSFETNQGFLTELFQIVQKHKSKQAKNAEKDVLSDETCLQIHEICLSHRQASKFNIYQDFKADKVPKQAKCMCGCGKVQGQNLPLCTEELQHYFFGTTLLVFFYLRRIVILLIVVALVYGVYGIVSNVVQGPKNPDFCLNPGMLKFLCPIKMYLSTMNKLGNDTYVQIQLWLGVALCVVWVIGARVIRSKGRNLNKKIDSLLDSSSDYVIEINNLPAKSYTETELLNYVGLLWKSLLGEDSKQPAIKSVQIVYQMDQARKMINKVISLALLQSQLLTKVERQNGQTSYKIKCSQKEYDNKKMELISSMLKVEEYRQKFINDDEFRKSLATGLAFVEFDKTEDQVHFLNEIKQYRITLLGIIKEYILSKVLPEDNKYYTFKGKEVRITRASEPSDINWSNCQKQNSYKKVVLVWMIALVMVILSFGTQMLIRFLRSYFSALQQVSILASISTQAFNRIIWNTLVAAISLEQNNTKTQNIISTMSKGSFAQAINVLILPLVFNYVMNNNLYGPEGLISSVIDYHFTFLIMQTFFNLLNVPYQFARLTISIPFIRNWIIRSYSNVVGVVDTAQQIKQVLAYYQTPAFNLASTYTSTNTIIFHTVFYIHVQPFLIFSLIFNLCYVYCMHKYLLLRRYKVPQLVDFIIFENCLSYLQHVPLIYSIGSLVLFKITQQQCSILSLKFLPIAICLLIWCVCIIDPFGFMNKITKKIVSESVNTVTDFTKQSSETVDEKLKEDMNAEQGERMYERKQSYYSGCGTNDLLEYQAKLVEVKKNGEYVSLMKLFCEKFSLKPNDKIRRLTWFSHSKSKKKNSMKMLSRIKQSFILIRPNLQQINNSPNRRSKMDFDSVNKNKQNIDQKLKIKKCKQLNQLGLIVDEESNSDFQFKIEEQYKIQESSF